MPRRRSKRTSKATSAFLTREDLLRGGESEEPAVVPGEPDAGTLIDAISWAGLEMPPKENDRLTDEQVELFRQWIEQGAPWPDEQAQRDIATRKPAARHQ